MATVVARYLRAFSVLAFSGLVFVSGCGSGGGGDRGGTGGQSPDFPAAPSKGAAASSGPSSAGAGQAGTLAPSAISATLAAAQTKFQSLVNAGGDAIARAQSMVAYLATQPNVAASGYSPDGSVWARLSNGQNLLLSDITTHSTDPLPGRAPNIPSGRAAATLAQPDSIVMRRSTNRGARTSSPGRSRAALQTTRANGLEVLPENANARVFHAMGTAFTDTHTKVSNLLSIENYNVSDQDATVEALKTVTNADVFYIDTHGDLAYDASTKAWYWSCWTSTVVADGLITQYAADLNDGSLVYWSALDHYEGNTKVFSLHFAFTTNFVKKYGWSFDKNSLVFFNCCYGAYPASDMTGIAHPAKCSLGYSKPVQDNFSSSEAFFLFDTVLGANSLYKHNVPQRPFDSQDVYQDMGAQHLQAGDNQGSSQLLFYGGATGLLPSIRNMDMTERLSEGPLRGPTKLTLHGWFGTQEGTVTIGGVEAPVTKWETDTIECTPADKPGAGFSGDVQVKVDQRESNTVPLTYWHGTLTYAIDLFPPQASDAVSTITYDAYFRGDTHAYRSISDGNLTQPDAVKWRASQGSTCKWRVTGSPPPGASWAGPLSADMSFGLNGTANPPFGTGYLAQGSLSPKAGTAQFNIAFLDGVTSFVVPGSPATNIATLHDSTLIAAQIGIDTSDGGAILNNPQTATLDSSFVIAGRSIAGQTPVFQPKLVLSDFLPTNQPDPSKGEDMRF